MVDNYTKFVLTVIAAALLVLTYQSSTAPTFGELQAALTGESEEARSKLVANLPMSVVYVRGGNVNTYVQGGEVNTYQQDNDGLPGLPGLHGVQ